MNKNAVKAMSEIDETKKNANIERLKAAGALIPVTDGVLIGDNVTVGKGTLILKGTVLLGDTSVGENCVLGPDTLLFDTEVGSDTALNSLQSYEAKIGSGCDIGPFTHIRPNTVIEDNVHLGNFVEVKNSNVDVGTKVSHLTYVGDSDVGKFVNFGCGTVTVNYNGKRKFRTTIGDHCFIGCNTNLVAPVKVGDGAYTAAGSTITDDVPADALGIARARQVNKTDWKLKD